MAFRGSRPLVPVTGPIHAPIPFIYAKDMMTAKIEWLAQQGNNIRPVDLERFGTFLKWYQEVVSNEAQKARAEAEMARAEAQKARAASASAYAEAERLRTRAEDLFTEVQTLREEIRFTEGADAAAVSTKKVRFSWGS